MFQVSKTNMTDTGITVDFTNGKSINVLFSDIPTNADPGIWLTDQLNAKMGESRNNTAKVVVLQTNPLKVAVSIQAN